MANKQAHLTTLIVGLLLPAALAAQEGITVSDFSGTASYPLSATAKVRRGTVSTVRIARNQIDLVPQTFITCQCPSAALIQVTKGKTSAGTGFIELKLTIPEERTVGAVEYLEVPGSRFQFRIVHKGQINSMNFVPIPTNIPAGQPFEVTVNGVDLGDGPNVSQVNCHTIALESRVNTSFKAKLTKVGGCSPLGPFSFTVRSSAQNDPEVYATSQGAKNFQFGPYVGCVAEPALGTPVVIIPNHNQVFAFLPLAPRIQTMQFRWHRATSNNQNAPGNEWLVELPQRDLSDGGTSRILPPQVRTVADTAMSELFRRPGVYHVAIRPKNCGTGALTTTIRFELR